MATELSVTSKSTREQMDAFATSIGIDPSEYGNKDDLFAAIKQSPDVASLDVVDGESSQADIEAQLQGGNRTPEEVQAVLDAPQVQLGQSDIDQQSDADEAQDRAIVTAAEQKANELAKARAEALTKGQEALEKVKAEVVKGSANDRKVVARFYLANPQHRKRVYRAGSAYPLQFRNGILTVYSEEDAELIRTNLRGQAFEQDFPDDRPAPACGTCGYAPRSYAAFAAHQQTHPVTG